MMDEYLAGGCLTVTGKICIFPFTLAGTTHYACTTHGNQNQQEKPWCSTKVDGNGLHIGGQGHWGECGLGCHIEGLKWEKDVNDIYTYTLRRPLMGEVLSTRIWGVPPAGGPLL